VSELTGRLLATLQNRPSRSLVHFEGVDYTGSDLMADVARVQALLAKMGVRRGDRVVIAEPNTYTYIATYVAMLLYGAVAVPVNPAMPRPELEKVMRRAEVRGALVTSDLWQTMDLQENRDQLPESLTLLGRIDGSHSGFQIHCQHRVESGAWGEQEGLLETPQLLAGDIAERAASVSEDAGAILLFTSGTTGVPKGVLLTHRQVMATSRNVGLSHELGEQDVCFCFLPLFHINAQVIGLITTLTTGGRMVLEDKFSASRFWVTVAEQRVTWVSAVPTVIAILIKSAGQPIGSHRPRFFRSASAPLPDLHARRFEARFGVPLIESYGMTEAASQICVNPLPPAQHKFGSAGRPFGVELRIVDELGQSLDDHEIGEIVLRGDSVITSYASGDDTGKSFRDGWFYTGDLGYRDADGFIYITGRSKEMINRAGQKISPREVEEVIVKHPQIRQAAVIGLPDDMYGERVVAYVIPDVFRGKQDIELKEQLRTLCKESVSAYKCPAEFHIVEEIPIGPTGKIQRHRLREQVLSLGSAGAGM